MNSSRSLASIRTESGTGRTEASFPRRINRRTVPGPTARTAAASSIVRRRRGVSCVCSFMSPLHLDRLRCASPQYERMKKWHTHVRIEANANDRRKPVRFDARYELFVPWHFEAVFEGRGLPEIRMGFAFTSAPGPQPVCTCVEMSARPGHALPSDWRPPLETYKRYALAAAAAPLKAFTSGRAPKRTRQEFSELARKRGRRPDPDAELS